MVVDEDIVDDRGERLLARGTELTRDAIEPVLKSGDRKLADLRVRVLVPA